MRSLTLGALIVSAGTLAALPFRRYQAIPDASALPVQATGPAQSVLDPNNPHAPLGGPRLVQSGDDRELNELAASVPWSRRPATPPPPRRIDIPLTFDDLERPIELPATIRQRFNATTHVREKEQQERRQESLGWWLPEMEELAVTGHDPLRPAEASDPPPSTPETDSPKGRAAGSLASQSFVPAQPPSTPPADKRTRQWIRQPQ